MEPDREDSARLRRGDTSGLAGLMGRYQDRLVRYLLRLLGDQAMAEDAFQQTWLRVAERISRYDSQRPFAPWLFAVARNLALDALRRRAPASLDEIDEPVAPSGGDQDPFARAAASPSRPAGGTARAAARRSRHSRAPRERRRRE